jgi:hypothetical protein
VQRIFAAAIILLSLPTAATAIPQPPPPADARLPSCPQHTEALVGLLEAITGLEAQFIGTPAWLRRLSQMQAGLADLPSPVVARFLAGKLEPLTQEPDNQEHFASFAAKRRTFYERMLVHSNPLEMTRALLADATRIENMMATLPAGEHDKLRFGQPEAFERFDAARFRLWEVRQFVGCQRTPGAR